MNQLVFTLHGKPVTDSLTVAEVFNKEHRNVLADIENQLSKLNEAGESSWGVLNFEHTQYQHLQNKQWYPKYNLTEDAFAIVAMSYVTPEAMKMKIKFLEEFKRMRQQLSAPQLSGAELIAAIANQAVAQEKRLSAVEAEQDRITEVLSLNPVEWRKKVTMLLNKLAKARGGDAAAHRLVRQESYELLQDRARCKLGVRVNNIKAAMALEGLSKSKINSVSRMDAIAQDARLTEIYLAIIKEMAIGYKVEIN